MEPWWGIIAVLVVLVIMVIYFYAQVSAMHNDYLYGCWIADEDFCERSGIESMMLFIGDDCAGVRKCHCVIMDDKCNQGLELRCSSAGALSPGSYTINAVPVFEEEQIWPDNITIDVDIVAGTAIISGDDVVYAKLNKQHELTNDV